MSISTTPNRLSTPPSGFDWKTVLLASTIPLLLALSALDSVWTDMDQYRDDFMANRFDYSSSERTTERLIAYFKEPMETEIGIPAFNNREADHMRDVKLIFKGAGAVFWLLSLVWLVSLALDPARSGRGLIIGGISGILLLAILSTLPFDLLFRSFHTILFPAGTWIFPPGSILITIYPERLFYHFAETILWRTIALHLAAIGAGAALIRSLRIRSHV